MIPLIAVHLFVFYYGIMGDITPPVGLATFAAAAISGENAIATGIQGSLYALRTVILPFIWIFNPQLLLIDIDSVAELVSVVVASTLAMLIFAAVTMNWFRIRSRLWETLLLAVACMLLFRPDFFMDYLAPEYAHLPAAKAVEVAKNLPDGGRLVMVIKGTTIEGDDVTKTVAVRLGPAGDDGRKRLAEAGLTLVHARRRHADLGRQVRLAREEVGLRAGLGRGADRGPVRPARRRTGSTCPRCADRARLVGAGTAHARRAERRGVARHGRGRRATRRADPRARALGRADQRRVRPRVAGVRADEPAGRQPVGGPRAERRRARRRG